MYLLRLYVSSFQKRFVILYHTISQVCNVQLGKPLILWRSPSAGLQEIRKAGLNAAALVCVCVPTIEELAQGGQAKSYEVGSCGWIQKAFLMESVSMEWAC